MFCKQSCLLLFLFSSSVFAANGHIYLGGIVGGSRAKIGNRNPQINYYDGFLTDSYPIQENHATTAILGVNGGYEFAGVGFAPAIALGLGIHATPGEYNYKGQLKETAIGDPSSTLYNFKYQVASTRLMLEAQFSWILDKFAPFINMGVGPAWSRTSRYTESSIDCPGYIALPPFQSRTNANFVYQMGLGIAYGFNFERYVSNYQHERITVGYRYANLGGASFGTRGTVYPYRLNIGRLATNEFYLGYTHLF